MEIDELMQDADFTDMVLRIGAFAVRRRAMLVHLRTWIECLEEEPLYPPPRLVPPQEG